MNLILGRTRGLLLLLVGLWLNGCATEGRDFSSDFAWLKKGITKQEDVRMVLGEPYRVGDTDGTPTWSYGYYRYKLIGASLTKELKIYWNADKTLQSYAFNSSFPEDRAVKAPAKAINRSHH